MEFKSFFKTVGGNEGNKCHYPTRLDTYGCGCQHDCKYCYAKSLLDFRKLWNAAQPAIVNIQKVHRTIRRNLKPGDIVFYGGWSNGRYKGIYHAAVYIGNGLVVHTAHPLRVTKMTIWRAHYYFGRPY